ncbi:copper resistance protein B [Stenotrophomonas sp. CPCC 101365]|uniref:Copper resistance protein B n=2 Tax=Stenotrophomonas mori TaxID=2871096 RepID=A0ABT0SIQ6_9GAMM|nr:copper resistance protein B [Stenotrophomonas mori]
MEPASHAGPHAADPHAGHAPVAAQAAENDPHASHAPQSGVVMANDPHAGHDAPAGSPGQPGMPADHAAHMEPASHAGPHAADPHAGHAMEAPAGEPAQSHDAHAGHALHGGHAPTPPAAPADAGTPGAHGAHGDHAGHGTATLQAPRTPIPAPTAADLAAAFPTLAPHAMEHAPGFNSLVLVDHLEAWNNAHGSGQAWAAKGWFGGDIDRLWLRSGGQRTAGRLDAWSLDALHGHAISPWWDVVAGVRHDGGDARGLTRAAIGVQGLAPYKFEFSATAYLGGRRRAELDVEAEYTLLLSNRLILQPGLEARVAADDDPHRGVGRGLGQVEAGLRLRYEITRRFAPYIGFVHERRFGRTADLHRDAGEAARDSRWVAGVRFWF